MSKYKIEHTFKISCKYLQIQLYIIENITDFHYGPDLASEKQNLTRQYQYFINCSK